MTRRALVLGAGGPAAVAWETGLVAGMAEAGIDVRDADLFVGTSAGARVAVQLASGFPLEQLFQRQLEPPTPATEAMPTLDWTQWRGELVRAKEGGGDPAEILRRIGALALEVPATRGRQRRRSVASQLPVQTWPEQRLLIVAVNAATGMRRAFDRTSGIDLVDAVTASGAIAGLWPPVPFHGHHYMDGGFYSTDNADLAVGCDQVLVVALRAGAPPVSVVPLDAAVETLRASGARVEVIHPDEGTQAAFASVGGNLLHPAVSGPAARAGRVQGRSVVGERVASLWL